MFTFEVLITDHRQMVYHFDHLVRSSLKHPKFN